MTALVPHSRPTPAPPRRLGPLGPLGRTLARRLRSEEGFTLIEVLASCVIVTVFALAALGGIDETTRSAASSRTHIDAQTLAQAYSSRLRGLTADELSGLNTNVSGAATTLDGTQFTVNEQAAYVNNVAQTLDCSHPSADYIKTQVTVTWPNMGGRSPVVVSSVVTPAIGGGGTKGVLYAQVVASGSPVAGATVSASGPAAYSGTTDSSGCVIFSAVTAGSYTLTVSGLSGTYVDMLSGAVVNGTSPPTAQVLVTGGAMSGYAFNEQPGGSLAVSFTSTIGGTTYTSGAGTAGAIAVVAQNNSMKSNYLRVCSPVDGTCPPVNSADTSFPSASWSTTKNLAAQTLTPLFPFNAASNPTGNYAVYAGVCSANEPAANAGSDVTATVSSGATTNATVTVPPMVIQVSTKSGGSATLPTHLYIRDIGCGVRYYGYSYGSSQTVAAGQSPEQATIPVNPSYSGGAAGVLKFPGLPYGNYHVCVDNGSNYGEATLTNGSSGSSATFYMNGLTSGTVSNELGTGATQC